MKTSLVWCHKHFLFAHKLSLMLVVILNFVQMLSWMNYIFSPQVVEMSLLQKIYPEYWPNPLGFFYKNMKWSQIDNLVLENHHWNIKEKEQEVFRGHSVLQWQWLHFPDLLVNLLLLFHEDKHWSDCGLDSNLVEHCLDHLKMKFKKKYYAHYSTNEHFCFPILLLKAWNQTWAAASWWFCFGSSLADLYCEDLVHYSNFLPFPCSILWHSSTFTKFKMCEREREKSSRQQKVCAQEVLPGFDVPEGECGLSLGSIATAA